jgi:hypothetical protein
MFPLTTTLRISNHQSGDAIKDAVHATKPVTVSQNYTASNTLIDNRAVKIEETHTGKKPKNFSEFDKITVRITSTQRKEINKKLALVTQDDLHQLQDICGNINVIQNKKKDFFLRDDFPYIALEALQQNNISSFEFATLTSLHAVVLELMQAKDYVNNNELPVVFHGLFNADKSYNEDAWNIMIKSIDRANYTIGSVIRVNTDKTIFAMKQAMQTKSPIEAGFWTFKSGPDAEHNIIGSISYRLCEIGANIFFTLEDNLNMLPSMSMRQEFLNGAFTDIACNMNPVIGATRVIDLRNEAVKRSRDFGIPLSTLLPLPKKADGLIASGVVDFQNHDFYHAQRLSVESDKDIEFYIKLGDKIKEVSEFLARTRDEFKHSVQKNLPVYQETHDEIQTLDTETKNKKTIELEQEFYRITRLISVLNKNIKALNRFKFIIYDLELINSSKDIKSLNTIGLHLINITEQFNNPFIFKDNNLLNPDFSIGFFLKIAGNQINNLIKEYFPDSTIVSNAKKNLHSQIELNKQMVLEIKKYFSKPETHRNPKIDKIQQECYNDDINFCDLKIIKLNNTLKLFQI